MLGLLVFSESLISAFWIYTFSGLGVGYAVMAAFPYVYLVVSYVSLLIFSRVKNPRYSTFTQLIMLLALPFFMQWAIGGFEASSNVAMWAVLAPVGALMILGTRASLPWFALFFALVLVSWGMDGLFASVAMPIPRHVKELFSLVNVCGSATILYFLMRYFESQKQRAMRALELEQRKSEQLLLNILPESIAQRLKKHEARIADSYDSVTILFADLVDFTRLSTGMRPAELVEMLNQVFSRFDRLTEKFKLEKIKTIGDAYMVVGGAPVARPDHAAAMADMALEMQVALAEFSAVSSVALAMRIGINSGPVVAGVIGSIKFSYDLWGDTVNLASRMEHYGLPNQIQVSEHTYQLLRDQYQFERREPIVLKGLGEVTPYILMGRLA